MRNQKLAELLHQYFELGVAEGREGRKHDTEAGDAQRVLSEIEAEIAALSAAEPQCCMCGKKGLSTAEGDGGTECELSDGRWVCSAECWDRAVEPAPSVAVTSLRGALIDAKTWHQDMRKSCSKQPPSTMRDFAMATHAEQIESIDTALSAQVQDVAGTVEAFDRDHPELYWHIAKGKITASEPLYGAIITDIRGNELGDGESNVSAIDAFNIAVDDAALPAAPSKQEGGTNE